MTSTGTRSTSRARFGLNKLAVGVAAALAMLGAAPAMAGVVNFETISPDFYVGGQVLSENGYALQVVDTHGDAGLAGVLINGQDPTSCWLGGCPANNGSLYYAGIADGALQITREGGGAFSLAGLDYAFIGPTGGLPNYSYGQLVLTGSLFDSGSSVSYALDFPGMDSAGNPLFDTASLSSGFAASAWSSLTIRACLFDGNGGCVYPQDFSDPLLYQAQFAIDNLTLTDAAVGDVPEPGSLALLGLGLGALTLRRRKSAARQAA